MKIWVFGILGAIVYAQLSEEEDSTQVYNCAIKEQFAEPPQNVLTYKHPLPYPANFLESDITEEQLFLHHDKHYGNYYSSLLNYLQENPDLAQNTITELQSVDQIKTDTKLARFAGGSYNHALFFWGLTNRECQNPPQGRLLQDIESKWGSAEDFLQEFVSAANNLFGMGYVFACVDNDSEIQIVTSKGQNNSLMAIDSDFCYPFIALDLWEHSYFLKYLTNRQRFVNDYLYLIDWDIAGVFYENYALQGQAVPL